MHINLDCITLKINFLYITKYIRIINKINKRTEMDLSKKNELHNI